MEIQVLKRDDGAIVLAMPGVQLSNETKTTLVNAINVLVEIFGSCFVLSEALRPVAPIRRAHWKIVTEKARSWATLEPLLRDPRTAVPGQQREVFKSVLESIIDTRPVLCAVGQQGFLGNVIFGFTDHRLLLLESARRRATLGIEGEWSQISQLPIGSLLNPTLASFAIPHSPTWLRELTARLQARGIGV
ncbi:MAG: hypothetical protein NVV63_07260 [Opitutus sp.]|nr:hypothetical protein [Opitutus sp.]